MTNESQPLDLRQLFRALADTELPLPVSVITYPTSDFAQLRLADDQDAAVDAWAREYAGTVPGYGNTIRAASTDPQFQPFRAYTTRIEFAGYRAEVCSYIREAVES
jgi:hypothetical protein